jgi:hypothetical protein
MKKYVISIFIALVIILPWYLLLVIYTGERSIKHMYIANIDTCWGFSKLLLWIVGFTLLFEFFRFKKFNSIFYLTVCFFALLFLFLGIIYQVVTSKLAIFHWDSDTQSLTQPFYIWCSIAIVAGLTMLILHLVKGRKVLEKQVNK